MELKKRMFRYYQTVLDIGAAPEAGADMIVPDLYPDMARIVDAGGLACIKEKNIREDRLDISGLIRVSILYEPEGETRLRKLDVSIPFNHVFDGQFPMGSEAFCGVSLLGADTKAVNPRKVSVLCQLSIHCTVYAPAQWEIPDEAPDEYEVRKRVCTTYMPLDVACKGFTMNEEMEIPASRPAVDEVLRAVPRLMVTDTKSVGNKVILKGSAILELQYLSGGEPVSVEQEFSISQIVEMRGLTDGAQVEVGLCLTGIELDTRANAMGESRQIGISLHAEAQSVAWMEQHLEAVVDVYSVQSAVRPVMEQILLTELRDRSVHRQSYRELVAVEDELRSVVNASVVLPPDLRRDGEGYRADAYVHILYAAEQGELRSVSHRMQIKPDGEFMEGTTMRAQLAGEIIAAPTTEGIELRFTVDYNTLCVQSQTLMVVTSLTEEEESAKRVFPSVVLRRSGENESLWDIAKAYQTTTEDLLQCNTVEDSEHLQPGMLILVPKKRS